MSEKLLKELISACAATITAHVDRLTELDKAIGDGDHGANMQRGFTAIADIGEEIASLPFGKALQKAGMTLVMKVGGASGPLYGSLLMAMGKAAEQVPQDQGEAAAMLNAGVEAVKMRGKSDAGAKTMLDVLVPLAAALSEGGVNCSDLRQVAAGGLASTKNMKATKGRASFLGERSIGHLDPGACSSALLVNAICDVLEA
ncbi:MAG TPA: dihydroxyacetone kinase subunit L [Rhodobacteraceae bacterium]|nr:dihydroxyacetone kinase subunit L [Paracoccaceae bacterium]